MNLVKDNIFYFSTFRFWILSGVIKRFNKLSKVEVIATGASHFISLKRFYKRCEDFCLKQNIFLKKLNLIIKRMGIAYPNYQHHLRSKIFQYTLEKNPDLIVFWGIDGNYILFQLQH